jgi:RNA polymerase sigma factor (sigma-70 family)
MAETKSTVTTTGRYEELDARDRALVRLIATGDRLAFDHLFRAYQPRLLRFLGQLTHRPQQLEELIDDTMLVVWRRADTFNYSSRVSTWIFAIAHRHALKTLRRAVEHGTGELDETGATDNEPERRLIDKQQRDLVRSALAGLPPEQRMVVELTYYHGCAYREIAQIVGCPLDTVKTRMFHARRKLRLVLQAQDMEGD